MVFGTKKLRNIGTDLGGAVKGFKDGIKTDEAKAAGHLENTKETIEGEVKERSKA